MPIPRLNNYHVDKQDLKSKPWLTKEVLAFIRKRRLMFRSHFLQGDENEKPSYRKFSNKLTKSIA